MRQVVLQMMTTLNGRLDDPGVWVPGIPDDVYSEINRVYATFDALLIGQTTYAELVGYWPTAENEAGSTENNKLMARQMNAYKKFVFSTNAEKKLLPWNNTEQVIVHSDADIANFVNNLKAQSGGDIHVVGGARFAQTIVRLGLVDEYRFYVYPVVSIGASWFDTIQDKRELQLVSTTPYENGIVGLHYRSK
jgi:dihydrofolate reductase